MLARALGASSCARARWAPARARAHRALARARVKCRLARARWAQFLGSRVRALGVGPRAPS